MKSLNKTLDILEYVFNSDGVPSTPGEVASNIKINAATCSRIMTELMERGYVEKVSRRTGYVPGPVLYALNTRQSLYARIARAAAAPVRQLAIDVSSMINISVMKDGYRYVLYFYSGDEKRKFPLQTKYFHDHYTTATGRLLLAVSPEQDIDFAIGKLGFPKEGWNGINSKTELLKELAKIAKAGTVKYPQDDIWIVGSLVNVPGCPASAIGFGVTTREKADEAAAMLKKTVADIEGKPASLDNPKPSFY